MADEGVRTCSTCKKTLPIGDFATRKSPFCRPCWSDYCRERRRRLSEDPAYRAAQAAKMRAWRAAHPNHVRKPSTATRHAPIVPTPNEKDCAHCGKRKPRTDFARLKNG